MELWGKPIAAVLLVVLWSFEALYPALHTTPVGVRRRVRHLLLGGLNAGVSTVVVVGLYVADTAAQSAGFGLLRLAEMPWWLHLTLALLLLDLWQYTCHVLCHHLPILWRVHAVHHHADRMEATVAMRFHTFEIALQGLMTIPLAVLLGISVPHILAYNVVLLPVSLFHHSDVRLSPRVDRLLRLVIVTPRMHWLHHSRWQPETNSNFSGVLSIWDRIFGTMRSRLRAETVNIGLDGFRQQDIETFTGMMATPFAPVRSEYGEAPPASEITPDHPTASRRAAARKDRRRANPERTD